MSSIVSSSSSTSDDQMHARYLAIQAERAAAPPKMTLAQKQEFLVAANKKKIAGLRAELAAAEADLAQFPELADQFKSLIKSLRAELKTAIAHKGTLFNGGVW